MKKVLLWAGLGLASSAFAASEKTEFDSNALRLLQAVTSECPTQFFQAMKGANQILSAVETRSEEDGNETVVLKIVTGRVNPAPSFAKKKLATLSITKVADAALQVHAPDAPTMWSAAVCKVE